MNAILISKITKEQWFKVLKALYYSFAAAFVGSIVLQASDIIKAVQAGHGAFVNLAVSVVTAAVIAGLNAVFVAIKQLFTATEEQKLALAAQLNPTAVPGPGVVITPTPPANDTTSVTQTQPIVADPVTFTGADKTLAQPSTPDIGSTAGS